MGVDAYCRVPRALERRVDRVYSHLPAMVKDLRLALKGRTPDAERVLRCVRPLKEILVEPHGFEPAAEDRRIERLRDAFVFVEGPAELVKLFEPPFAPRDLLATPDGELQMLEDVWFDALETLREVCFTHPDVSEVFCRKHLVLFFFQLMGRRALFDIAASILEELLAVNPCLFRLDEVPRLGDMVAGLSCRQLAVFCRVLALLIYDPEDRQMLESAKVIKSHALLQLRRDRASRTSAIVEANQACLLRLPAFLDRLVKVLHIVNFAPDMDHLAQFQHIHQTMPHLQDPLQFLSNYVDGQDWDYWEAMLTTVDSAAAPAARSRAAQVLRHARRDHPSLAYLATMLEPMLQDAAQRAAGGPGGTAEVEVAVEDLADVHFRMPVADPAGALPRGGRGIRRGDSLMNARQALLMQRRGAVGSADEARTALRLHGLVLVPFQVEVFFVLCTMLQGRRKADVQTRMLAAGGAEMLTTMFDRLAWERVEEEAGGGVGPEGGVADPSHGTGTGASAPDATGNATDNATATESGAGPGAAAEPRGYGSGIFPSDEMPQQGIHGPGCECNPESALRVQFLRLVHAFCDRDSEDNSAKWTLLSHTEGMAVRDFDQLAPTAEPTVRVNHTEPEGLVLKIARVLQAQRPGSVYKFWLSSCVEAFLRGSTPGMQQLVASSGVLSYLLREVLQEGPHPTGALQTAFDLLAELSKGSTRVIRLLDDLLTPEDFHRLTNTMTEHFIDSNVFLRAILCTMERHHEAAADALPPREASYFLTTAWRPQRPRRVELDPSAAANEAVDGKLEGTCAAPARFPLHEPIDVAAPAFAGADTWWRVPRYLERFASFVAGRYAELFRDLATIIEVLDVNHENICCLNTALALVVAARRRDAVPALLEAVRHLPPKPLAPDAPATEGLGLEDADFCQLVGESLPPPRKTTSVDSFSGSESDEDAADSDDGVGERASCSGGRRNRRRNSKRRRTARAAAPLRNFRELLWFWRQYYDHRGRDRLTLEFSSQIPFGEWDAAVAALTEDRPDAPEALLEAPTPLPPSPFDFRANNPSYCAISEMEGAFDEAPCIGEG